MQDGRRWEPEVKALLNVVDKKLGC